MAQNVCTVFDKGCFHCAKSQKGGIENKKTRVSKMVYHYPEIGSLFIQETTTQVEKKPKEFPKKVIKTDKPVEVPAVGKQTPNFDLEHDQSGKLKHCWSGITFIDEKYERDRENVYRANLRIALANRKRWTGMQKSIERQIRSRQVRISGPDWYQELSYKQLSLLESFADILNRDYEEKSVSNTRKFLKELGITPLPDNNFLRGLLENCKRDPLYFFDQIRREIRLKENQRLLALRSEKDPISDVDIAKRKYSVSERILLSTMFTIHLPLLLFKLHLILPQDTLKSKTENNILSRLPKSLESSLPEPKKRWFKSKKSDSISFKSDDETFAIAEPKNLKDDQQPNDQDSICDSTDDFSDPEAIAKFVDASVQTETPASDSEPTTHPSQNDVTSVKDSKVPENNEVGNAEKKQASAAFLKQENADIGSTGASSKRSSITNASEDAGEDDDDQMESISLTPNTDYEKVIAIMMTSIVRVAIDDESEKREKIKACLKNYDVEGLYELFGIDSKQQKKEINEDKASKDSNSINTETPANDLTTEKDPKRSVIIKASAEISETKLNYLEASLEKLIRQLREAIIQQPKKKQLKAPVQMNEYYDVLVIFVHEVSKTIKCGIDYALSILANAGDPLASFPEIQSCQPIIKWYQIRTGIKKSLSDYDKEKLMLNSRKAWNVLMASHSALASQKTPRCILTSKQLANYTWDKKKWAMSKINSAINNHKRNIRQAMVDDSRLLFSTMNDLDYDSNLNKNIRRTFFTYLPAAETDSYV